MDSSPSSSGSAPRARLPPLAHGLPLVGSTPHVLANPIRFLMGARERYGDIYTLDLGVQRMVVLNHPRQLEHIFLTRSKNYLKQGALWDAMRTLLGNGLAVSQGEVWRRQRRMVHPQFHRQRLARITSLMVAAIEEQFERWDEQSRAGQSLDAVPMFAELTMKLLSKSVFGTAVSHQSVETLRPEMLYVIKYMVPSMLTQSLPSWVPRPGERRYQQALERIDRLLFSVIEQRRGEADGSDDLLSMLLEAQDEETGLPMQARQLRDETLTLFLAGYETTSVALAWAVHYILEDADVWRRLREEVEQVFGEREPTFGDVGALQYTRMVIQESLRICPPIWWNPRLAMEDDEIDGYAIPKGSVIAPLTYVVHHHPDIWKNPERFDPLRFSSEEGETRHRCAWGPFGIGPRKCVGVEFAMMEAQLVLAMFVRRYDVRRMAGAPVEKALLGTLRPKAGIPIRLHRRRS